MECAVSFGLISVVFALSAITWSIFYWIPRRRMWELGKLIPGPDPLPIIGNSMVVWGSLGDTFQNLLNAFEVFGPVVRLWLGNRLTVLLLDPEDIQMVLGNPRVRNRDDRLAKAMLPFFGDGLLSNRDEKWRVHRKIITPTFHFKILETYVEIFGQKTQGLMRRLFEKADGRNMDIHKNISLCTLDAICETAIGAHMDSQKDGYSDFQSILDSATTLVHNRAIKPWLLRDWIYPWTKDGKKARPIIQNTHNFSEGVIAQKLADYRGGARRSGITTSSGKTVTSFLDMLIEASETQGQLLSPQEMRDEVTTMAAAGLETTASSMSFFLILIGIHPEIQQQLYEELQEVFGDDPRPATPEDIHRLHVMDRVIKETLRLFPIVTILPREISEEIKLPSGYTLPAGCTTWVLSYVLHRKEANFPEPERFWPDRWLPENSTSRHPYAYLPFSAGPRNCVGQKYAMLQMKSILSMLLRRFKVTTDYKMEDLKKLEISITLNLGLGKYLVRLEKRKE